MLSGVLKMRMSGFPKNRTNDFGLEPHQFYPRGAALSPDFVGSPIRRQLALEKKTPIASMGSCFAREIKRRLVDKGYNYLQTENNGWSIHASCAWERVYTSANVFQILNYTDSGVVSPERLYVQQDRCLDLWRNKVAYDTREDAESDIQDHIIASRAAIEQCELLILTIGQNEIWCSKSSGQVYARRPPEPLIEAGEAYLTQLSVEDNVCYLEKSYAALKKMNSRIKLLLTLSPVPSRATFYDENVVVRSLLNKSILRVAIARFQEARTGDVFYLPSYEIVQTWRGNPYLPDNRHVKPKVIEGIMKVFFKTYSASD